MTSHLIVNDQSVFFTGPAMKSVKESTSKRRQSEKTSARILEAALSLFVNKGYHGTSIAEITQAAHITKGALYCHFSSKGDLLLALIRKFETEFLDNLIRSVNAQSGDALAKLHRLLSFASDFAEKNRELCLLATILSAELQGSHSEFDNVFRRLYAKYARFLHRLIEDGKLRGVIDPGLDTHSLAYVIIAFHDGILLQWQRSRDLLDGREYVRAFRRTLLSGVRPRTGLSGGSRTRADTALMDTAIQGPRQEA
ncbi:MAG: TetR/AcrR family transcriptional regulator [Thermodesulfobacteriota bacterium]